jgi:5-methylcytosine-specific restriction endonuclease McrA
MTRPPHLCPCGFTVPHGALCNCQQKAERERKARHDQNRPTARERGYDSRWERERVLFLALYPYCRKCGNPATTVDHIFPHRGDRALFWNRSNWQPLCTRCHNSLKQRQERRMRERQRP